MISPFRLIPEGVTDNLSSSNWRERLESINRIYSAVSSFSSDSPAFFQALIRLLLQAPGFKESNVQVFCLILKKFALLWTMINLVCSIVKWVAIAFCAKKYRNTKFGYLLMLFLGSSQVYKLSFTVEIVFGERPLVGTIAITNDGFAYS